MKTTKLSQNVLISIRNQLQDHENINDGLFGTIFIKIPHVHLINVINLFISWKFEIISVGFDFLNIKYHKNSNLDIINKPISSNLEELDIIWIIHERYDHFSTFYNDFARSNVNILDTELNHDRTDLEFEIAIPNEMMISRKGTTYFKYKEKFDIFTLNKENLYSVFYKLNNLVAEEIKNFNKYNFQIGKIIKTIYGYKILENE